MTDHDPLLAALADLDPTAIDAPPPPGSPRDRQILETAMTAPAPTAATRRPRRVLALVAGGIAATVLAIGLVVAVDGSGDRPDPVAALTTAADETSRIDSLRVQGTYRYPDGSDRTLDIEMVGRDARLRSSDGEWSIRIGDQEWTDEDPDPVTMPDELRNVAFPDASRVVVRAALEGAEVTDLGDAEVRGQETSHYRIELGDQGIEALRQLAPNQVAMFELEYPEAVRSLDVWVADDLIRRIDVQFDPELNSTESVSLEFYDLGADITIRPPS